VLRICLHVPRSNPSAGIASRPARTKSADLLTDGGRVVGVIANPPDDDPPETFADRLRALRRQAGLTQAEVARRAGVAPRAYETWERGERMPRTAVPALAVVFNVSPRYLLEGELGPERDELTAKLEAIKVLIGATVGGIETHFRASRQRLRAIEARLDALEVVADRAIVVLERLAEVAGTAVFADDASEVELDDEPSWPEAGPGPASERDARARRRSGRARRHDSD
jgi:transcriptional regulator with XRE-family HTH domain